MLSIFHDHNNRLDTRGLRCPDPLMMLRKAIRNMIEGQTIFIIADDPAIIRDITSFCVFMDHQIVFEYTKQIPYLFLVRKGAAADR